MTKIEKMYSKFVKNKAITAMEEDIMYQDINGDTLLHLAVYNENLDVIKYLIEHGANALQYNYNNVNPLMVACGSENIEILKYIIQECSTKIKATDKPGILDHAVVTGICQNIEYLLQNGLT